MHRFTRSNTYSHISHPHISKLIPSVVYPHTNSLILLPIPTVIVLYSKTQVLPSHHIIYFIAPFHSLFAVYLSSFIILFIFRFNLLFISIRLPINSSSIQFVFHFIHHLTQLFIRFCIYSLLYSSYTHLLCK